MNVRNYFPFFLAGVMQCCSIQIGVYIKLNYITTIKLFIQQIAKKSSISGGKNPEGEVAKMVILMVSAFLVAWLPYAGFALHNVLNPDSQVSFRFS